MEYCAARARSMVWMGSLCRSISCFSAYSTWAVSVRREYPPPVDSAAQFFKTAAVDDGIIIDGHDGVYAAGIVFGRVFGFQFHVVDPALFFVGDDEPMIGHRVEKDKLPLVHGYFFGRNFGVIVVDVDVERSLIGIHDFKVGMMVHAHAEVEFESFGIERNGFQSEIFDLVEGAVIHDFQPLFFGVSKRKRGMPTEIQAAKTARIL